MFSFNKFGKLLVPALFIGLFIFLSCTENINYPPNDKNSITSVLVDEQGTPIPGAILEVNHSNNPNSTVLFKDTTDEDGKYTLEKLPNDLTGLSIKITHPDFKLFNNKLNDFKTKSSLPVILSHNDSCEGVLKIETYKQPDSSSLGEVEIRLYRSGSLIRKDTAKNGIFVFEYVCPGTYIARLYKYGYGLIYDSVKIEGTDSIDKKYYLKANEADTCCNGILKVFLIDSKTGKPPTTGPTVSLLLNGSVLSSYKCTGGYVYFSKLCAGTFQVKITGDYYETQTFDYTSTCNKFDTTTRFIVPNGKSDSCCHGKIVVTVKDSSNGKTIDTVKVMLLQNGTTIKYAYTSNGTVTFTDLCPGTYSVYNYGKSGWTNSGSATWDVTITCNDSLSYTKYMVWKYDCCYGKIVVIVKDSSTGNNLDTVKVQLSQNGSVIKYGYTTGGKYTFTNLCTGTYSVYIYGKTGWTRTGTITWDATLNCNDSLGYTGYMTEINKCCHGKIVITIADSTNGNPIDSCYVGLSQNGTLQKSYVTSGGLVSFTGLCQGTYSLYYGKSGWYRSETYSWNVTLDCNDSAGFRRAMIPMSQCCDGTISGTVTDTSTGNPVINSYVNLYQNNSNIKTVKTDSSGYFQFTSLCPGTYSFTVAPYYYYSKSVSSIVLDCSDKTHNYTLQVLHK